MSQRGDAHRIGQRAADWLCGAVHLLDVDLFHEPLPGPTVKAIADISVLVRYRVLRLGVDKHYARLGEAIVAVVDSPAYPSTLRAHPRDLHLYGLPYSAATAAGYGNAAVDEAICDVVATSALLHVERRPYEQLGVLHFLECCLELGQDAMRAQDVVATTLLARRPDPARIGPAEAYAIAHSIFYLTDYGRRPATLLPRPLAETTTMVEQILCRYRAADAPDLVAELATAMLCLRPTVDEVLKETLAFISLRQRTDGTVALNQSSLSLAAGSSLYAQRHWWNQHYHTAVVTALLAALIEEPGRH